MGIGSWTGLLAWLKLKIRFCT